MSHMLLLRCFYTTCDLSYYLGNIILVLWYVVNSVLSLASPIWMNFAPNNIRHWNVTQCWWAHLHFCIPHHHCRCVYTRENGSWLLEGFHVDFGFWKFLWFGLRINLYDRVELLCHCDRKICIWYCCYGGMFVKNFAIRTILTPPVSGTQKLLQW